MELELAPTFEVDVVAEDGGGGRTLTETRLPEENNQVALGFVSSRPTETRTVNEQSRENSEPEFMEAGINRSNETPVANEESRENLKPEFMEAGTDRSNETQAANEEARENSEPEFMETENNRSNETPSANEEARENLEPEFMEAGIDRYNETPTVNEEPRENSEPGFMEGGNDLSNQTQAVNEEARDSSSPGPKFMEGGIGRSNETPAANEQTWENSETEFMEGLIDRSNETPVVNEEARENSEPEFKEAGNDRRTFYREVGTSMTPPSILEAEVQTSQCWVGTGKGQALSVTRVDAETCISQHELSEASTSMTPKSTKDEATSVSQSGVVEDCTYMSPKFSNDVQTSISQTEFIETYTSMLPKYVKDVNTSFSPRMLNVNSTDAWASMSQISLVDEADGTTQNFCDAETSMSQNFLQLHEDILIGLKTRSCSSNDSVGCEVPIIRGVTPQVQEENHGETIKQNLSSPSDDVSEPVSKVISGEGMDVDDNFDKENETPSTDLKPLHLSKSGNNPESVSPSLPLSNMRNIRRVGLSKNFKPSKPLHHNRRLNF